MNIDKNSFRALSYGVYVVSVWDNGRATGCVANSAMQITSSPSTIAISINHDNYTNHCIKDSGFFSLSVLGENVDPLVIGTFGFSSGKYVNKYEKIPFEVVGNLPVLKDSCAQISCKVINTMETNSHTVFLGEVMEAVAKSNDFPMTYAYYHNVIKGKSPKNAPTFINE